MLLRAAKQRDAIAEAARCCAATKEAKHEHLLEQGSRRVSCAHCKEEAAELARQLEEDMKKAEAAQDEAFACLLEEDRRRTQNTHRQAMEKEGE